MKRSKNDKAKKEYVCTGCKHFWWDAANKQWYCKGSGFHIDPVRISACSRRDAGDPFEGK